MIRCQNCGADNRAAEVYCYHCGALLRDVTKTSKTTTTLLENDTTTVDPKRRWGTARFDAETVLTLSLRDFAGEPLRVNLNDDQIIGRKHNDYAPNIDLSPYEGFERGVSRQHAVLRRKNDTIVVVDLNSANYTFLNGQRLVPDQPRILRDGDELRLGTLVLRVSFEQEYD